MAVNSCLSKFTVNLKQQKIAAFDMHRIYCYILKLDFSICSLDMRLHDISCVCTRVGSNDGVKKKRCICSVSRLLNYMLCTTETLMSRANCVYQVSLYHCVVPARLCCCPVLNLSCLLFFLILNKKM